MAVVEIEGSNWAGARDRLRRIGAEVETVSPGAARSALANHQVLYFACEWAATAPPSIADWAGVVKEFAASGGALVFGQPNVDGTARENPQLSLLPFPARFEKGYLNGDRPTAVEEPDHPLVRGLEPRELPFPADTIHDVDPGWTVLARGGVSRTPALLVADLELGRVVLYTSHESETAVEPFGDRLLVRLVAWAAAGSGRIAVDEEARREAERIAAFAEREFAAEVERLVDLLADPDLGPPAERTLAALGSRVLPALWARVDQLALTFEETSGVDALVARLASEHYSEREEATRALLATEPRLVAYVLSLRAGGADLEQARRLEHVQGALRATRHPWLGSAMWVRIGRVLLASAEPEEIARRIAEAHPFAPDLKR